MIEENKKNKIAFVGGDERQIYAAMVLSGRGYSVEIFGFDNFSGDIGGCKTQKSLDEILSENRIVVLPMPVSRDGESLFCPLSENTVKLDELFDKAHKNTVFLGGNPDIKSVEIAGNYGFDVVNYFDREELLVANAFLTAESGVAIALSELKNSVCDYPVLVIGHGRIGKMLCHLLKAMGASVYASARKKSDFAWIRAFGYSPVNTCKICEIVTDCRLIFNTVPNLVLGKETLGCLPKDCLVIDLASKPGGVDFEAAKNLGLKVIWALALPGKFKQKSAGKAVAETIISILEDMEVI